MSDKKDPKEIRYQHYVKPKLDDLGEGFLDYEKLKDGYLEGKCTKEMWERYILERKQKEEEIPEDIFEILRDPEYLGRINKEFDKKIVREEESRKVIFLITQMRNVENLGKGTDNLIVNALSGTGKDHITESIFEILPNNEKEELVKTTPKVLSYTRNRNIDPNATWKKTALRLEDVSHNVVNDDSFKVFLSANPNKINSGKTVNKGKVIEIEIEGKPSIVLTIANTTIGEEQLRRLPNLFLDEGIDQTKEILKRQARLASLGESFDYDPIITSSLIYLKRVKVKIPYAEELVKIFDNSVKNVIVRTAFPRFLDYIKSSAGLFQYQREKDEEGFVIATKQDFENGVMMLRKTTSNIYMIPLSRLDENIYDLFKEKNFSNISLDELMELDEIQKLGKSDRWIRFRLDFLVSKGFLTKKSEKVDGIFKPVSKYGFSELQQFNIPSWEELMTSNSFNTSNTSNSSNTSNTKVNEVNEVNETPLTKTPIQDLTDEELEKAGLSREEFNKLKSEAKNEV